MKFIKFICLEFFFSVDLEMLLNILFFVVFLRKKIIGIFVIFVILEDFILIGSCVVLLVRNGGYIRFWKFW